MTNKFRFEERLLWLKKQTKDELKWEDEYLRGKRDAYLEEIGVIELLQGSYAPHIEMTTCERNCLLRFKKHWSFTAFIRAIEGNYQNNMYFENVESAFKRRFIDSTYVVDEDQLMQAWLHPETIINSETGKPFVEEENA